MRWAIAVPSYGRPDWKALKWLREEGLVDAGRVHLWVHSRAELQRYEDAQDLRDVIVHVQGPVGIHYQRTNIMRFFSRRMDHIQLDDDVTSLMTLTRRRGKVGWGEVSADSAIEWMLTQARLSDCRVFGLAATGNALWEARKPSTVVGKHLGRAFIGIRQFVCDLQYVVSEDSELALEALRLREGLIRFNRFKVKAEHVKKGGCEDLHKYNGLMTYTRLAQEYEPWLKGYGNRRLLNALVGRWKPARDMVKK